MQLLHRQNPAWKLYRGDLLTSQRSLAETSAPGRLSLPVLDLCVPPMRSAPLKNSNQDNLDMISS